MVAIGFALATFAAAPHALADVIDGDWCSAKGENLMIEGPKIRIPSGVTIEGQYSRHEFAYQPPEGDPDQGAVVYMELLNEETMVLRRIRDGKITSTDTWHRCNVISFLSCHRRIYSGDPLCHMTNRRNG